VALGTVLNTLFGLDLNLAIFLVAMVGMGYTLQGGMWSVTLTDAVQMVFILVGVVLLGFAALARLGGGDCLYGWQRLLVETDPLILRPGPTESLAVLGAWLGVFCIGALGNIPAQDLTQRIFAAKSGEVARTACLIAGGLYLVFGSIPLMLALAGRLLLPDTDEAIIMELARELLRPHPLAYIVFILAVVSAVLSTIDSAILAPASVLSQNILGRIANRGAQAAGKYAEDAPSADRPPTAVRWSVFAVTMASLAMAYLGEDAYELLEGAYTLPFVGLFVPLTLGLYMTPRGQRPALISMCVGTSIWLAHYAAEISLDQELGFLGSELPVPLLSTLCGLGGYLIPYCLSKRTP
jgi:Na+/proline symporter